MPHIAQQRIRKLGTYPLSRNGIDLNGPVVASASGQACWNFVLTGTAISMSHPRSPDSIYSSQGVGQNVANAILDINIYPPGCNGLRPTATVANHPNCGAELTTLNNNINNARNGNPGAQHACAEALVKIVAIKNGLVPGVADDQYQLHMKATNWFGWDHWALSIRPAQPGRPRIYIQTVTDAPLAHACSCIWDEHLPVSVTVNIGELHHEQIALIDAVQAFGDLCADCGEAHGRLPSSPLRRWHRCVACRAIYCPTHGHLLAGKLGQFDGTRQCKQPGCFSRTELISSI